MDLYGKGEKYGVAFILWAFHDNHAETECGVRHRLDFPTLWKDSVSFKGGLYYTRS